MTPPFPLTRTVCTECCCWIQDCPFPAFIHIKHMRTFFFLYSEGCLAPGHTAHLCSNICPQASRPLQEFSRVRPASAQAWLLSRPASAPSSSSCAWLPGPWGRRVVGQEEALGGAAPHGLVRVEQQPREAVCEVLDKAVGDLAQCLPDLTRKLPVVVLLQG